MTTITTLNKASNLEPFRKCEIKRRLADSTGNYEASWVDITSYVNSFGNVSDNLDKEQVGVFKQGSMTLIGDNTQKAWNDPTQSLSLFNGFSTRYGTLFKISYGLKDSAGTEYPSPSAAFYGILTDDIVLTDTSATLVVNSILTVFDKLSASKLTLSATDTASDIMYKIMTVQDASAENIVSKYISGSSATVTTTAYTDVTGGSNLSNQSCLDIINRLCLTEDYVCYIDNNGTLQFQPKTSGTTIQWKFNGPGIYDEVYGVNIANLHQGNNAWTKIYNQVAIEYQDGVFGTAGNNTWSQGDQSSPDKYGERVLNISEAWLGSSQATTLATALYTSYKDPKLEVEITTSTFNPQLKLLDRVTVNWLGESSTDPSALWGEAVWGVDCWTGETGGIYINAKDMNIIGKEVALDPPQTTKYYLRSVS